MARHRHILCVPSDGLSTVLERLLAQHRILAATLLDASSGLVLDGYVVDTGWADLEQLAAGHADLVRGASAIESALSRGPWDRAGELTVDAADGWHHLLQPVPDPHGDRLVLVILVHGGAGAVRRARRRLRTVSPEAITAGPSLSRRPVAGTWLPSTPEHPPTTSATERGPTAAAGGRDDVMTARLDSRPLAAMAPSSPEESPPSGPPPPVSADQP
ncbi:hypothetical protein LQ327_01195 [Actinomycetospora endophytica]|uniref:Roadblock/LAMTOR2 domain-containing protein n=1 Tax=Actinomycetospora endophytica TaxID=2291215 RepID=A0ABS8P195_9PSEU|nr:hypothetical protein [Actinomycetospora endophytica]MCD2192006.1 hypothetical protein [Actinomycetospora endophytica]